MKNILLASLVVVLSVFSFSAFAHLKKGIYEGRTATGTTCSFEVKGVVFEGGMHHPLTERFVVNFRGKEWKVGHPFVFSAEEKRAAYDHDHLVAFQAMKSGAEGIQILMDHSEGNDGPVEISYVMDDYRDDSIDVSEVCSNLVFKQE